MRQPREFKKEYPACYVCSSKVVYKRGIFDKPTTRMFLDWMERCAAFCGVSVPEATPNRFGYRLLVVVHDPATFSDDALSLAYGYLYGPVRLSMLLRGLAAGGEQAAAARRYLRYGVGRIDVFQQLLKQGFTTRYNFAHKRKGTLWQERYSSIMLADDDAAIRVAAVTLTIMAEDAAGRSIPQPNEDQQQTVFDAAIVALASSTADIDATHHQATATPATHGSERQSSHSASPDHKETGDRAAHSSSAGQNPEKPDWQPVIYAPDKLHDDGLPLTEEHERPLTMGSVWWRAQAGDKQALKQLERYFPPTAQYTTLQRYEATKDLVRWILENPEGDPRLALPEEMLLIAADLVMGFFETIRDLRYYSELTRRGYGRVMHVPSVFAELVTKAGQRIERAKRAHTLGIRTTYGQELHMLLRPLRH